MSGFVFCDDWQGTPKETNFNLGVLGGVASFDKTGAPVRLFLAVKLLNQGFVPEINDQVFLEFQGGPVFGLNSGDQAIISGVGLRWMFYKTTRLAFYALGGLRAQYLNAQLNSTSGTWGATMTINPSFGAGVSWELASALSLRAEYGLEMLSAGFSLNF